MGSARITATAAASLLLLVLAGCGSPDNSDNADSSSSGSGSGSSSGSGAGTSATPTPTVPQYKQLTKSQLTKALLTIDDLPPGYSADPKDDSNGTSKYCGSAPPIAPTKAGQQFTKGGGFSSEIAGVQISQYPSPAAAQRHFTRLRHGLDHCKGETADGDAVTYALMSAPRTGHPTLGLRVSGTDYTVLLDFAQVGPSLVIVGTGGVTSTDADLAADLLTHQVHEYEAAAQN